MKRFIIKKIPYVIDMFSRVNFVSYFCLQIKENFFYWERNTLDVRIKYNSVSGTGIEWFTYLLLKFVPGFHHSI